MKTRPLSPHLSIYRFAYTMATSIFHRATGLALSAGLLLLVGWLTSLAMGAGSHASFTAFAASWPVKLLLASLLVALCYHFANGIRHLVWDTGRGLERREARLGARLVVIATVLASALLVYLFFGRGGMP
jgi:succinate dehydrogenase / fumarate reductase cytochrome b subunit